MDVSCRHSSTDFAHHLTFIASAILQKLLIYRIRRWFLFGMRTDVNFQYTPKREINE